MLYAALIYQNEDLHASQSEAEREAALERHRALQRETKSAGRFVEASQLKNSGAATTLRRVDGELLITDGPFAETKELLIGLYVFDCETRDQAIAYAGQIVHADTSTVEIRPIEYHEVCERHDGE